MQIWHLADSLYCGNGDFRPLSCVCSESGIQCTHEGCGSHQCVCNRYFSGSDDICTGTDIYDRLPACGICRMDPVCTCELAEGWLLCAPCGRCMDAFFCTGISGGGKASFTGGKCQQAGAYIYSIASWNCDLRIPEPGRKQTGAVLSDYSTDTRRIPDMGIAGDAWNDER